MAHTAVVAVSRGGASLARRLVTGLGDAPKLYLDRRFSHPGDDSQQFDLPLRPLVPTLWADYREIVFFLPVGAVVRLIAPHLRGKHDDPAVVCVDESGRFAVSLVSGHVGGADKLALDVAAVLGATPVVTSASHVRGILAVDLLGNEFGWKVEAAPLDVTRASAAVVNGGPVGIFQEAGEPTWQQEFSPLAPNIQVYPSLEELQQARSAAMLVITDEAKPRLPNGGPFLPAVEGQHMILYRPRSLMVGMGCRRGVPMEELETLLLETFSENNLALGSLACLATADLKADEEGLLALADKYGVPLVCYSGEELNAVFQDSYLAPVEAENQPARAGARPTPSERARSLIGVWGVSEPAALLSAGSNDLLVPKCKSARATVAVARKVFPQT